MASLSPRLVVVREEAGTDSKGKTSNIFDKALSDFCGHWHIYLAIFGVAADALRSVSALFSMDL